MLTADERTSWQRDGFFVRRAFAREPGFGDMLARVVAICRGHAAGRDVTPALVLPEAHAPENPLAPAPEARP